MAGTKKIKNTVPEALQYQHVGVVKENRFDPEKGEVAGGLGDTFLFLTDRVNGTGFRVKMLTDGIEVMGYGIGGSLILMPDVSNVVTVKSRESMIGVDDA